MKENILKSALLISVLTIIGKIIGFLRTIIIAYFFEKSSFILGILQRRRVFRGTEV